MAKILIVEDDLMLAEMTEMVLSANGYVVCGVARTVAAAVALGQLHRPDFALIDVQLANHERGTEIAAELGAIGRIGILYVTGSTTPLSLSTNVGDACVLKPCSAAELIRALEIVVADLVATDTASPPFPYGFQILNAAAAYCLNARQTAKGRKYRRMEATPRSFIGPCTGRLVMTQLPWILPPDSTNPA